MKKIGNRAFEYCKKLKSIKLSASLEWIGEYVFDECAALTGITIPDSVTTIGLGAFYNCVSLETATLPGNLVKISEVLFRNCISLQSISIPASVTLIERTAFAGCTDLREVTFAGNENLTEIAQSAFVDCKSMESIDIPDSVTNIGYMTFQNCKGLKSVDFPDSLIILSALAFNGCESLEAAILPNGMTDINTGAFQNCSSLADVSLPNTLESINNGAFKNCTALTEMVIPETVWFRTFCDEVFYGCENLEKIYIPMKVDWFGKNLFTGCPKLTIYGYNNSPSQVYANENDIPFVILDEIRTEPSDYEYRIDGGKAIITRYMGDFTNIAIPSELDGFEVVGIGNNAFARNYLETVIIPDTVQKIGNQSFSSQSLKSIVIPDSVTEIDNMAFLSCYSLTNIELPDSVDTLGDAVFAFCENLTEIKLSNSLTGLPKQAFLKCVSLETIELPSSITAIGEAAFKECTALTEIDLSNVSEIAFEAFAKCTALKDIAFSEQIEYIRGYTFADCTSLEKIVLPNGLIEMENSVFEGCTSLVEVVLPEGLTWISGGSFKNCTSLKIINIPSTMDAISTGLFAGCTALEEISLPDTIKWLYSEAFKDCTALKRATILWSVDKILGVPFENCPNLTIYGKTRSFIHNYADENSIPFVAIGEPAENPGDYTWKLTDDKTAVIITGYIGKDVIISIPSRIEGKPVVELGNSSFGKPTHIFNRVESVIVPDTVTKIGIRAFQQCRQLSHIEIPDSVVEIEEYAFYHCDSLKDIVIPDSVRILGNNVFSSCVSLEEVQLPQSLTHLPNSLLNGCESLKNIKIPSTVTSIGMDAFASCYSLTEINIPATVKEIGRQAFRHDSSLLSINVHADNKYYTSVDGILLSKDKSTLYTYSGGKSGDYIVPGYVTKIVDDAFFGCKNLTSLILHKYIETAPESYDIGIKFELCENLLEVVVMNQAQTFGYDAFGSCHEDFVLYGLKGSAAQDYATKNGVTFQTLNMQKNAVITGNVDVIVYDTAGDAVSTGKKTLSNLTDGYIIEFTGKGTGTMTYTIQGVWDKTGEVIAQKSFTNVPLANGKIYTSEIVDIPDIRLTEIVDGKPVKEINEDGTSTEIDQQKDNTIIMRLNSTKAFLNRKEIAVDPINDDVSPFTLFSKTMVSVRFVEQLGARVEYKSATEPVIVTYGNIRLTVVFGSSTIVREKYYTGYYEYDTINLPTVPTLVEGKTYVPIREIAEALGFSVSYNPETFVIVVSAGKLTSTSLANSFPFGKDSLQTEVVGVKSISIKTKEITLKIGESYQFDALEVTFDPVTPGCKRLTYSSNLNQVATVTSQGRIVAYEKGTAEITVSSHNGKTDIIKVAVE